MQGVWGRHLVPHWQGDPASAKAVRPRVGERRKGMLTKTDARECALLGSGGLVPQKNSRFGEDF
ncbi:MAG: hypothetical protein AB4290_20830 [Spirulina sp.]